jgi:hypothetical protein
MATLSGAETRALLEALDDEHRALATYDQVIADFGPVRPFINIRDSEARHIGALLDLARRYEIETPPNPWPGRVPRFSSVREACEAGVRAEIENHALYERLLHSTTRADILEVFRNLQRASQERHLPAFRRGASRTAGRGPGHGGGQRHRHGRR